MKDFPPQENGSAKQNHTSTHLEHVRHTMFQKNTFDHASGKCASMHLKNVRHT